MAPAEGCDVDIMTQVGYGRSLELANLVKTMALISFPVRSMGLDFFLMHILQQLCMDRSNRSQLDPFALWDLPGGPHDFLIARITDIITLTCCHRNEYCRMTVITTVLAWHRGGPFPTPTENSFGPALLRHLSLVLRLTPSSGSVTADLNTEKKHPIYYASPAHSFMLLVQLR